MRVVLFTVLFFLISPLSAAAQDGQNQTQVVVATTNESLDTAWLSFNLAGPLSVQLLETGNWYLVQDGAGEFVDTATLKRHQFIVSNAFMAYTQNLAVIINNMSEVSYCPEHIALCDNQIKIVTHIISQSTTVTINFKRLAEQNQLIEQVLKNRKTDEEVGSD